MRFYVGGYSPKISVCELDVADGSMRVVADAQTPKNGSWLSVSPDLRTLYATVESGYDSGSPGTVAAYRIASDATLSAIGTAESCAPGPCHLAVDATRRILTVANYGGETFGVVRLDDSGTPGEVIGCGRHAGSSVHPKRQREPHPHATVFSPDYRYLYVCDLGTDEVVHYSADALAGGVIERAGAVAAPAGSGPRHIVFTPDGRWAYLVNELSNTVIAYSVDTESGALSQVDEQPMLPPEWSGESTAAEIWLHPSGRFVYASNRGHDSIVIFSRRDDGTMSVKGHVSSGGQSPRHFSLDSAGVWCLVANQQSDNVVSYRVDHDSGMLAATGHILSLTQPSCAVFAAVDPAS